MTYPSRHPIFFGEFKVTPFQRLLMLDRKKLGLCGCRRNGIDTTLGQRDRVLVFRESDRNRFAFPTGQAA